MYVGGARFPSLEQVPYTGGEQCLRQETQVGHNNDPDSSGELSDLTRKGLVSVLTWKQTILEKRSKP